MAKERRVGRAKNICIIAGFGLLLGIVVISGMAMSIEIGKDIVVMNGSDKAINVWEAKGFSMNDWIDCMPPLTESESRICREAELAGYDKIAY